ncbi:DNA-3-methyladenine glycosylase [Sporosarcina pasteurii]|uniref:Putative 3-methyladenine DNA glycosylase n=1 Tax=Sporosarcina pasteurii TaxID=1474 RepID=A0A380CGV5_SPOPA|nr:DNA-3-methyladenine glycosylase [Sporosarcina pasteurii]MDS9472124.1 DNA-3-methyladenine glycosylase [Sporosarcina pasteurii]QBQ06839.1 DNA-3-methyladenine glycosylase [Sporosarcina pasteurii]SUJ20552.1 3-methyladenine DNA glycosylase [Sporosarcina pasteurii]
MYEPVDKSFFEAPGLELAKQLIGQYIVHEQPAGRLVARIVETEAYQGPEDRAAHSFGNRRTKRTEIMFGDAGLVYTYQMHTHTLINVVAGPVGTPHAILIRAVEPVEGHAIMRENRGPKLKEVDWTNGPGKLTVALGITMDYYGHHWSHKPLFISKGEQVTPIEAGPRVGIGNSGEAVHYPWRFYEKGNPFVSKYRK